MWGYSPRRTPTGGIHATPPSPRITPCIRTSPPPSASHARPSPSRASSRPSVLADEARELRAASDQLAYALLRVDAMSPADIAILADAQRRIESRLDSIEQRVGTVESKFARWEGAMSMGKWLLGFVGISNLALVLVVLGDR